MWNSLKNLKIKFGFSASWTCVRYHGREEVGVHLRKDLDSWTSLEKALGGVEGWDGENVGEYLPCLWQICFSLYLRKFHLILLFGHIIRVFYKMQSFPRNKDRFFSFQNFVNSIYRNLWVSFNYYFSQI